jgi:hypothetical protein
MLCSRLLVICIFAIRVRALSVSKWRCTDLEWLRQRVSSYTDSYTGEPTGTQFNPCPIRAAVCPMCPSNRHTNSRWWLTQHIHKHILLLRQFMHRHLLMVFAVYLKCWAANSFILACIPLYFMHSLYPLHFIMHLKHYPVLNVCCEHFISPTSQTFWSTLCFRYGIWHCYFQLLNSSQYSYF